MAASPWGNLTLPLWRKCNCDFAMLVIVRELAWSVGHCEERPLDRCLLWREREDLIPQDSFFFLGCQKPLYNDASTLRISKELFPERPLVVLSLLRQALQQHRRNLTDRCIELSCYCPSNPRNISKTRPVDSCWCLYNRKPTHYDVRCMRTKVFVDVRASAKTVEEDITAGKPFLVANPCSWMLIAATTSP